MRWKSACGRHPVAESDLHHAPVRPMVMLACEASTGEYGHCCVAADDLRISHSPQASATILRITQLAESRRRVDFANSFMLCVVMLCTACCAFVPCHTEARNRRRGTRTRRRSGSARRRQMQPTSSVAGRVEKCVVERLWPQSRSSCVRCLLAFRAYPLSAWESCELKLLS